MKKIFKGIAILAATAAVGAGVAFATGCGGSDGVYYGSYHYTNEYGAVYGMVVEVTVENNIIKGIKDLTNTDNDYAKSVQEGKKWTTVSSGWVNKYVSEYEEGVKKDPASYPVKPEYSGWTLVNEAEIEAIPHAWYSWSNDNEKTWTKYENWLLQQYEGWSVADILDVHVFYSQYGEPYALEDGGVHHNAELEESGLLISGSTQGSGRLMLAVQDALKK